MAQKKVGPKPDIVADHRSCNFRLTKDTHRGLRVMAAERDQTMQVLVREILEAAVAKKRGRTQ